MSKQSERRRPEEIESEIYQTRARLDDTLHELEERFSPQYLVNAAFDYVRQGGANDVMANVGRTVKQNPLPFMLTGIGLGWMLLSRRDSRHAADEGSTSTLPVRQVDSTSIPPTVHEPTPTQSTAQPPRSVGASATDPGTTGAGTTSTGADPASVGASATDTPATPRVGGSAAEEQGHMGASRDKARQMMDNVKGRTQRMTGTFRDRAAHVRSGSQSAMRNMGQKAQGAGGQTTHFIQDHPIVAGAIGIAIGAALGSLFPSTRVEDERLGKYRDRTMHKAAETGQQQAHRAQEKVYEQADKLQEKVHERAEQAKSNNASSSQRTTGGSPGQSSGATGNSGSATPSGGTPATGSSGNPPGSDHPPTRGG